LITLIALKVMNATPEKRRTRESANRYIRFGSAVSKAGNAISMRIARAELTKSTPLNTLDFNISVPNSEIALKSSVNFASPNHVEASISKNQEIQS